MSSSNKNQFNFSNLRKMNLPNKLTLLRLILILPLVILMSIATTSSVWFSSYHLVWINLTILLIFIVAMTTDFLDGFLARKYNQVTDFGKLWDPIADKAITNLTLIYLTAQSYLPLWVVFIFILRDLVVAGFRVIMTKNQISIAADFLGKIKTILLSFGIVFLLLGVIICQIIDLNHIGTLNLNFILVDSVPYWVSYGLGIFVIAAAILSIVSGFEYFQKIKHYIKTY
ncbi:CDP-diacylglycerol--glycerol-3-phosphate 3-phosphatidyltransferase [Mycoplasmopsis gallopavonis]|uniref:CDP-diacylglycerol--glycerol-3-phosphate 3-phosphatidyltransferase n=1 Tax=Mycoplasmopsis gallopavonis TaxID=76629 RepID=A0A449B071_9BACT|nr:CDP-diacylglycerol--glycerol-3-phosphate 3-phosphatidyltransferase [Mycoplasmopsis gallopavonis]RIV16845.1 CDP-diacylglycerol--glycerol-3-phosphate 3-phosphatidyltransferase [Mycoplasmopsis gallopavonis]VEU73149.1 CDP-diacylglycerol--glycerol-3-phosphate 3-phosphatidyltransferase [Mycoplasmopsis gallopavonis]